MPNQFTASLWGDEAFSAVLSMNSIPELVAIIIRDTSPPLYNITENLWFSVFGSSEVAIRSLSFLYYSLTIFFVFLIGKLLWDKKTGILAAVLAFLNPFFFIYAFEGRMYSILALGVTASMYFFLKAQKEKKTLYWIAYVLATTWALYSHHFALFAIFIQGLWFLYELIRGKKTVAKSMFFAFIGVFVLYIPWLYPLYKQTTMVGGGFWLGTPTVDDLGVLINEYLAKGIKNPLAQYAYLAVLATLVLRQWNKNVKKTLFIISWFLGPILLTWLVSQKFQSIFYNRYLLYSIPAAMILLASNTRKISYITLAVVIILFAVIDVNYFTHPTKRPFRELASYVKSTQQEGDFLINWNSSAHHLWETKYYEIPAPIYVPEGELPFYVGTAQMTDKDILKEIPEDVLRVGVVTSGSIDEVSLDDYTEEESRTFGELKFIWLQKE